MKREADKWTRRKVLRVAVAVGGSAGLSACTSIEDRVDSSNTGRGPPTESITETHEFDLPERQHAWNRFSRTDEYGNPLIPHHHVLLLADYTGTGPVQADERNRAEQAFSDLEDAYGWSADGLLFTVGYSPAYFDRYDAVLPDSVDLPSPVALSSFEDPEFDTPDMLIHLASDRASAVIEAEQALFGETEKINGEQMSKTLDGLAERVERRTGFHGAGLPAKHDDASGVPEGAVPEEAPLFMGFKSGFVENQASEDSVTITDGPFAGGTTQQLSFLRTHLDQWYNQDSRWQRVAKMFSPEHAQQGLVEGVGNNLGDSSRVEETGIADTVQDDAFEQGVVGHTQKTARVRDEDGNPLILRRDFPTVDGGQTGLHFLSLQETISDFVKTREAMNGEDVANVGGVGTKNNNGILQYITTERRGNFLIPPRSRRAFPRPR